MVTTPVLRNLRCRKQFLPSALFGLTGLKSQDSGFHEGMEGAGASSVGGTGVGIRPAAKLSADSDGRDELHATVQRGPAAPPVSVLLKQSLLLIIYSIWDMGEDSGALATSSPVPGASPAVQRAFEWLSRGERKTC